MEGRSMSDTRSDEEKNFFVAAAETYLDVDSAMAEFQRQVQDECKKAISARLGGINQACGVDRRLEYFREYRESGTGCIYLGRQLHLDGFGGLYFYLTIFREYDRTSYGACISLYRQNKKHGKDLWDQISSTSPGRAYTKGNSLYFSRPIPKDQLLNFQDHLDDAISDFLAFITANGGLKKHLAPASAGAVSASAETTAAHADRGEPGTTP
jgi:hypothetical protein